MPLSACMDEEPIGRKRNGHAMTKTATNQSPTWAISRGALRLLVPVLLVGMPGGVDARPQPRKRDLPTGVERAIRTNFPRAIVISDERDRENGVRFHNVDLSHRGLTIQVEIAHDGSIGEVEGPVAIDDVPASVLRVLLASISVEQIVRIERHERWGVPRDGTFAQLDEPRIFYEAKYRRDGKRRQATVRYKPAAVLSARAREVIESGFSSPQIRDVRIDATRGARLFEVVLANGAQVRRIVICESGIVVEVAEDIEFASAPPPVVAAIQLAADGADVAWLARVERRAAVSAGHVDELPEPRTVYRTELTQDNRIAQIELRPDGTVSMPPVWTTKPQLNHGNDQD